MASFSTPVCETLGVRYPIFGFSHEPEVVVAIARAGGFPVLGLAREIPEHIPRLIEQVEHGLAGRPYGIDIMLPANVPRQADLASLRTRLPATHRDFVANLVERFDIKAPTRESFFTSQVRSEALFDKQIGAILDSRARAVATAIGLRTEFIDRAKERGKLTIALVGSPRHARKALSAGAEVLVAQGADAGGHTGPIGTMSLLPQIVELAGDTPVLAAGGIATGAQVLGSLAMGAQGAWLGTLWMGSRENRTPPGLLKRLVSSNSEDTVISRAHSGKPCRVVRSEWIDAWHEENAPAPLDMPMQQVLTGEAFAAITEHDDERLAYDAAGQSIFRINGLTTVADQMATLVEEMEAAWTQLQERMR